MRRLTTAVLLWVIAGAGLVAGVGSGPPAWGCPLCAESLPNGADRVEAKDAGPERDGVDGGAGSGGSGGVDAEVAAGGSLAEGFYYSILFMMAMPFVLVGGFGGVLYWGIRKSATRSAPGPAGGVASSGC
jgi:hypothetical protein